MKKFTQSELRTMVEMGMALDFTNATLDEIHEQQGYADKLGYSMGLNGMNGLLFRNTKTGECYAILRRSSVLDYF